MSTILLQILQILNESAVYLLAGFLIAGLLHVLLQRRQGLLGPLRGTGLRPVFIAPLIGAPLPLCSCAVLPAGLTLMRSGASKGTTASFLLTVPETDVVSVLLTFSLMGPVLAVARPVAGLITGICTGLVISLMERRWKTWGGATKPAGSGAAIPEETGVGYAVNRGAPDGEGPARDTCADGSVGSRRGWIQEALHYGYVEFFDDLIGRFLVGVVLGAGIAVVFARVNLTQVAGHQVLSYAAMLLLGIPVYVCAAGSTPIAAGFIAAGISPGAALVFLLAGPATNLASLLVLEKEFGRRIFSLYLTMIAVVSVLMGISLDLILRAGWLPVPNPQRLAQTHGSPLGLAGTIVLLFLALLSAQRRGAPARAGRWIEKLTGLRLNPRGVLALAGGLVLAGWLTSGLCVVGPGQRVVLTRFGAVSAGPLGPGLHYHWPVPFGGADRIAVGWIHRVTVGFPSAADSTSSSSTEKFSGFAPSTPTGVIAESWMLTGDENFVDLGCVVQYQVQDRPQDILRVLYAVGDPDALVQATARRALQQVVGTEQIDSLLTVDRGAVEQRVRDELLQPELDSLDSGLRIVDVRLISTHAPPPVHYAFRDVASAAENAMQFVNAAHEYSERVVREGLGDSALAVQRTLGEAAFRVHQARGDASSFAQLDREYRHDRGLTRSRLRLEMLEEVLPKMQIYVDLTGNQAHGPDIWLRRGSGELPPFVPDQQSSSPQEGVK